LTGDVMRSDGYFIILYLPQREEVVAIDELVKMGKRSLGLKIKRKLSITIRFG
jgi:hypothetical protein